MLLKLLIFSALIALGKASGFAKELFISYFHGVSPLTDTYVVSNTIASVVYIGIYASIPLIVVPLYAKNQADKHEVSNALLTYLLASSALIAVTWLGFSFFGLTDGLSASSQNKNQLAIFVLIATLTFLPSTISAFFNSLHSVHGVTQWTYAVPIVNNVAFCLGIVIFPEASSFYLVLAVGLASWILLAVSSGGMFFIQHWKSLWRDFRGSQPSFRSFTKAAPTIAFAYLDQLLVTVATLAAGAIMLNGASIFNYSLKLLTLFATVVSLLMTTFAFTRMSKFHATGNNSLLEEFSSVIFELTVRVFLPMAALLSCLSPYLIKMVFERGAFTAENSLHVSQSMSIVSFALPFLALKELLTRFMFATFRQAHCISAVLISLLSFFASLYGCTYFQVPNAASISYLISSIVSAVFLTVQFYRFTPSGTAQRLLFSTIPAIAISAVLYAIPLISNALHPVAADTLAIFLLFCYLAAIAPYVYSLKSIFQKFY